MSVDTLLLTTRFVAMSLTPTTVDVWQLNVSVGVLILTKQEVGSEVSTRYEVDTVTACCA